MSCERMQSQISWYLYNELSEEERNALEEHLEGCSDCTAALEKERAFLTTLDARRALEPAPALLAESRHDLMRSIYRAERLTREGVAQTGPLASVKDAWFSMRIWWQPALATCLLAMGFFSGWSLRSGGPAAVRAGAALADAGLIANIASVNVDEQAGQVQISYDEMQRQTIHGGVQDPRIQKFLILAARQYANPSVRLDTVDILKDRAANRDVRNTLLEVVANDSNDGVRLKAMEGLKAYAHDPEVRQALIGVLTKDDNPGMRVQAIDLLVDSQEDHSLVGVLQGVAQHESNNYVRMRCQNALRAMNASVETF